MGYLRVSALDQKELRQLEGVELDKRFTDKAAGKNMHRLHLQQLMEDVREGGYRRLSRDGSPGATWR